MHNLNQTILYLILGATIITASIRILPVFIKIPDNNPIINKFFEAIPYSVLTVLIFPDIFTAIKVSPHHSIKIYLGILIVILLAIKKVNLAIIVIITMLILFGYDMVFI